MPVIWTRLQKQLWVQLVQQLAISATGHIKGDCKGSLDVQDNILQIKILEGSEHLVELV